jgi:hypothetical protein
MTAMNGSLSAIEENGFLYVGENDGRGFFRVFAWGPIGEASAIELRAADRHAHERLDSESAVQHANV